MKNIIIVDMQKGFMTIFTEFSTDGSCAEMKKNVFAK